ncbi:MarR family winged helix-turn-helix transcriptional regulator [Limnohabitans sp.]
MPIQTIYQRPGFLLRRAHQISASIFERACAELALTPAQYGVLCIIQEQAGIDQSSLARALAFDKVTVLRVLKGLEERGFCQRTISSENRRQMSVSLTAAGRRLLQEANEPVQKAHDMLLSPFSAAERAQFMALLQTLTTQLDGEARASFVPMSAQTGAELAKDIQS